MIPHAAVNKCDCAVILSFLRVHKKLKLPANWPLSAEPFHETTKVLIFSLNGQSMMEVMFLHIEVSALNDLPGCIQLVTPGGPVQFQSKDVSAGLTFS